MTPFVLTLIVVILAWIYDFWNGANDAANSIATTVSTHAMTFKSAVIMAAVFNMAGAFATTEVAKTIGKGIVNLNAITTELLASALVGAIVWVVFSTRIGIPVSVTHSLIGGLIGPALVGFGFSSLNAGGLIKVGLGIFVAPLVGFLLGGVLIIIFVWIIKIFFSKVSPSKIFHTFRFGQIFSAAAVSFSHGMNDSQNAMGVITAALVAGGFLSDFKVPLWVIFGSGLFMALGTLYGGQKVIRTLGCKIYKIKPFHGFTAELSSAVIIIVKSFGGVPLSTTHVVSSAVIGAGAVERPALVNWRKVFEILWMWVFTIPGAAFIAWLIYSGLSLVV